MEKTNYVFESPADEALFTALTPLSVRIDVFPVVYGPEEDEIFRDFLKIAEPWGLIRGAGKDVFENPNEYGGLFNPNDGEAFFRVAEGGPGEKRTLYFRATSSDSGLFPEVLSSDSEVAAIETFSVNYGLPEEIEGAGDSVRESRYRTRVFYRTTGCRPRERYSRPRFFDLVYGVGGENIETVADYEARKEADRIKEEAEARKLKLRRRIIEEVEYLRREVRRVEALVRTAETEEAGSEEEDLFRYLNLLESVREDFGKD